MTILGTSGRPMVELGGAAAWKQYTKGDIVGSLQWVDLRAYGETHEDGPEPVLAIFAANRRMDAGAYLIPATAAHQYADNRGNPTMRLMGTAMKAAITLGFHPDRATVYRIADLVVDAIPDLVRMPSTANVDAVPAAPKYGIEATLSVNGKAVVEQVL